MKYQTDERHRAKRIAQGNNRTDEERAAYYQAHKADKIDASRRYKLNRLYELTPEQYEEMAIAQNYVCKVCGCPDKKRLSVDHDHVTGKVRGLLCTGCNLALGFVQDNPAVLRDLAEYLEEMR